MSPFLVIEGLDGAGTTTQTDLLARRLLRAGRAVLATREPTHGVVGQIIRRVLAAEPDAPPLQTLPWLFAADRATHVFGVVEPALAAGTIVVSDRYYHSSLAYQSLTLPLPQVHALNAPFRAPDLTVLLDVPVDECLDRIQRRGGKAEIYEVRERLEAIASAYEAVVAFLSARGERIARVDGTASVDDVAARVLALVGDVLAP